MKTSKIILITTAIVTVVVFIIFALILRNTIQTRREEAATKITYQSLPIGEFSSLKMSDQVSVRIRQGKDCSVEYAVASDSLRPVLNNVNGTLHISAGSVSGLTSQPLVKITMPRIYEVSAGENSEIRMNFFTADSVRIILDSGCVFNGSNNTFKKVSFVTSGEAQINISSTF